MITLREVCAGKFKVLDVCAGSSLSSSTDGSDVYYIQVMMESSSGDFVPVRIPGTVMSQSSNAAAKELNLMSSSSSAATPSVISSLPPAAVATSSSDAKMNSSAGITLATKQVSLYL